MAELQGGPKEAIDGTRATGIMNGCIFIFRAISSLFCASPMPWRPPDPYLISDLPACRPQPAGLEEEAKFAALGMDSWGHFTLLQDYTGFRTLIRVTTSLPNKLLGQEKTSGLLSRSFFAGNISGIQTITSGHFRFSLPPTLRCERIKPGDKLVCYMTKLSRWFGILGCRRTIPRRHTDLLSGRRSICDPIQSQGCCLA